MSHPAWCLARPCTVVDSLPLDGGEHRSEPIGLPLRGAFNNQGALGPTTAYLTKAQCAWDTETFLHLDTAGNDLSLPLSQTAGLLAALSGLVEKGQA